MSLVERGVYVRSWLTPEGREVLVAVDYRSREVGSITLEPGENRYTSLAEMWDLLDLHDPEHTRRKHSRGDDLPEPKGIKLGSSAAGLGMFILSQLAHLAG